jgi:hypothetical protein
MTVNVTKLTPVANMSGSDTDETLQLRAMLEEATQYLRSFHWCRGIANTYFGLGIGGIVAVFLFEIDGDPEVDRYLWVVVGDLPSAYFVTDLAPTPVDALSEYCTLMQQWARAAAAGGSLDGAFPVAAAATEANANQLLKRIHFLRTQVIPAF